MLSSRGQIFYRTSRTRDLRFDQHHLPRPGRNFGFVLRTRRVIGISGIDCAAIARLGTFGVCPFFGIDSSRRHSARLISYLTFGKLGRLQLPVTPLPGFAYLGNTQAAKPVSLNLIIDLQPIAPGQSREDEFP